MASDEEYENDLTEVEEEGGKPKRASTAGRKLMRWNPDVDQYVLLAVDIVCSEQGCAVPWNLVAEKINDFLTGEGIKQHLAKVRKYREQSGRSVPYKTPKGGKGEVAGYNSGIATPQRTPKKKGSDNSENEIFTTGKGAGLLWTNPKQKKPKEPTAAAETKQDAKQEVKEHKLTHSKKRNTTEDTTMTTLKTPANKSDKLAAKNERENAIMKKKTTGKRGRAKKNDSMKEEDTDDEAYMANGSPSKKQRSLRATYHVNYNDMPDEEEEDVFDARSRKSDDDAAYGRQESQLNKVEKSQGFSKSSCKSAAATLQAPPNFDSMLHSRTGTHAYGDNYTRESYASHFQAPFTALNNAYSPGTYGTVPNMVPDQEAQISRIFQQQTADQQQMQVHGGVFEGYGASTGDQRRRAQYGGLATPARMASKKGGKTGEDGDATALSKKTKLKSWDTNKANFKRDANRKQRKDSIMQIDDAVVVGLQQQASPFHNNFSTYTNNDSYGNIPIANDTGHGIGSNFGGQVSGNVPNFSLPFITHDTQQAQLLTASPTDKNGDFTINGFMGGLPGHHNGGNTGITPDLNSFRFDAGANFTMAANNNFDNLGFGAFDGPADGLNSSFSSSGSGKISTNGLQSDQATSMSFDAGVGTADAAGVGLGMDIGTDINPRPWMPQMDRDVDTDMDLGFGGVGDGDDDLFNLLVDNQLQ